MFFTYMLLFIPLSLALEYIFHAPPVIVFVASILAIIPLAVFIQRGTEEIAYVTGPTLGGLMNVTFGNAAELIIALFVLSAGQADVVKGQITGSIIGNGLLGLGLAVLIGTMRREKLTFNRDQAGQLSTMLVLVLIGLLIPAIFDMTERDLANLPNVFPLDENLSLAVSVVLILLYVANLVYTLVTHRSTFASEPEERPEDAWPVRKSLAVLLAATALTAWESEIVSTALGDTASMLGVSTFFLGVVVLALIGNVAEYVSAIFFARKGNMDLVMGITVGATIQVALFVAPLLVIISYLFPTKMDLVFANPIELVAIGGVALAVDAISKDGQVTWFEGALLIGVYLLLAIAFYFVAPI